MHVVGVIEMVVGAVILAGYTRLGGYVAAIWLVGIAVNLVTTGRFFDIAVRDVAMAIAAFTLARLTEAGVGATAATQLKRRARWTPPRQGDGMRMRGDRWIVLVLFAGAAGVRSQPGKTFDDVIARNAERMLEEGRRIFRFDTFGDEAFWGGALKLHQAIAGERHLAASAQA